MTTQGMVQETEGGYIFLIDKSLHWTSFDVVNKMRYALKIKKVGHAGTLDPLATGLVIVCAGKATKQIESFMATEKEYTGTFRLGVTTPSYDLETETDQEYPTDHITVELIHQKATEFLGPQMQIPPIFSALKVDGKKLYELARKGKEAKIEPRPIEIKELEITAVRMPEVDFRVVVSKGTYIRSLAFDFGKACGSGAVLSALRRTRVGDFEIKNAMTIPDWLEWWQQKQREIQENQSPEPTEEL
jgi:tRNA pseudouridine55 synthase